MSTLASKLLMITPLKTYLTLPRLKPGGSDSRQRLLACVKGATPMGRRYLTVSACTLL